MGQKINPIGFRLVINHDWESKWFARGAEYAAYISRDYRMRERIRKDYAQAMISRIEIGCKDKLRINIFCARPGLIIGKKGEDIEKLRLSMRKISGAPDVTIDVRELRHAESNARLVAQNIASQLEKRVMFRRAMRRALQNARRVNVLGIKIMCKGRLNGAEIARFERYHEGRVPLHTLRAHIDYGFAKACTSMGVIGIKVWIFKGETPARAKAKQLLLEEQIEAMPAVSTEDGADPDIVAPVVASESEAKRRRAKPVAPRHGAYDWDDDIENVLDEDDFGDLSDLNGNEDEDAAT